MQSDLSSLLSLPSVTVLPRDKFAQCVSDEAKALLAGEDELSIAVSGGQIAPHCLSLLRKQMGTKRHLTLTVTDERHGVHIKNQNVPLILGLLNNSGCSENMNLLAPFTSLSRLQSLESFLTALRQRGLPTLALMGVGIDGHIASLFSAQPKITRDEAILIENAPGSFPCRITLTMDYLLKIPNRWALIVGSEKGSLLQKLMANENCPVNRLLPTRWFIDSTSVSAMSGGTSP